jgi:hypothetical protein
MEDIARKLRVQINEGNTKCLIVERKNSSIQNKTEQLTIKSYTFERVDSFKYLGVILNEVNDHQITTVQKKTN